MSDEAMPHMSVREGTICGVPTRLFRMSFTGERGFEVNVPADYGQAVWEALWAEGQKHGACAYGTEAMHVLRAEKGYIIVGQDTDGTVTPDDAGLDWAVGKKKPDFVGMRGLTRPDLVAAGPQAARRPADQGSEDRAGGGRADRRRSEPADPDDDDRPRHLELLVGELRPLDRPGAGRRRPRADGRDAVRADAGRRRSRSKSARRCSSTRREAAQWLRLQSGRRRRAHSGAGRPRILRRQGVKLAVLPPAHRISLRAPAASVAALSKALGLTLPQKPKTSAIEGQPHRAVARAGRMAGHRRGRQRSAGRLRRRRGAAFGGRHFAPQCRDLGHRSGRRRHAQCRLPAGSVARRLSGRRLLAHHPRQGRDRAVAHRRGCVPRRMLALLLRLRLHLPDGSRAGCGCLTAKAIPGKVENLRGRTAS